MDPKIDQLVTDLRSTDISVRKEALDELGKLEDRKHIIPAIHWTMLNDIDDEIREYAREIYMRTGEQEKAIGRSLSRGAPDNLTAAEKEERRVHLNPTLGWPNPWGRWSIHFSLLAIALIMSALLVEMSFIKEEVAFLRMMKYIGLALTIPGLLLSFIGLCVKVGKKSTPITGLCLNASILLLGIWNMILQ